MKTITANYSLVDGEIARGYWGNLSTCKIEYSGQRRAKASIEKPALRLIRELVTSKVNQGFVLVDGRVVTYIAS